MLRRELHVTEVGYVSIHKETDFKYLYLYLLKV